MKSETPKRSGKSLVLRLALPIAIGLVIALLPTPAGVTDQAWRLLAIFVATIAAIVLEPLPMGAVAVLGIVAVTLSKTLPVDAALSGFAGKIIWLVVAAFFISRGFIKTGLGARIAYTLGNRLTVGTYTGMHVDSEGRHRGPDIRSRGGVAPIVAVVLYRITAHAEAGIRMGKLYRDV